MKLKQPNNKRQVLQQEQIRNNKKKMMIKCGVRNLLLLLLVLSLVITPVSLWARITSSTNNVSNVMATDSINIALIANASTSYVSAWESMGAVNDGFVPSNSNDKSHTAYGNWDTHNTYQWVQYDWDQSFVASSVEIYWFDDTGGILTPDEAYIENYNSENASWERITDVPCIKDKFNQADLGKVTTSRIRVTMKNYSQSTGILEFRVWGTNLSGTTDIKAPSAPGKPEIVNISANELTINWEASSDDDKVAGYNILVNDSVVEVASSNTATVENIEINSHFFLAVQAIDASGNSSSKSEGIWVFYGDEDQAAEPYSWPVYSPTLDYNFRDEFPELQMPTKDLDDCPQVVGTQSSGWWTFKWGPNKRSEITEAAITPMLERFNEDFAYFRNEMGWPPDKRARNGYRSAIYLFGSGLCTDDADTTALGGWMGSINYQNESWPMVLASYFPVYSFDPDCPYPERYFQMGAMIHEGIHAILADLPGCKQAAWFHEGGNTWLQQEMEARKSQSYESMGYLNVGPYIAPFMPIECYSGWLQDGSFGGPSAEGVNMWENGKQICTWRKLLGGTQYGNTFPTFLGQALGTGSVAWIWKNCPERVLEGMAAGIGESQIRRLIMEYRAKQALIDMKEWSGAIKNLLDNNMNGTLTAELEPNWIDCSPWKASPYVKTWMLDSANNVLTPEPRTTPGWSGANQIPLRVSGDEVVVNFTPLGENMTCQLCYRATDGTPVYSYPVSSGECRLNLDKAPANGVVIAVICNTNYIYNGEVTRKAHYDYRLQLVKGIDGKASVYKRWYDYNSVITDVADPVEPFPVEGALYDPDVTGYNEIPEGNAPKSKLFPNPVTSNEILKVIFNQQMHGPKDIRIVDSRGTILYIKKDIRNTQMEIPIEGRLGSGVYFLCIQSENRRDTEKFIIR